MNFPSLLARGLVTAAMVASALGAVTRADAQACRAVGLRVNAQPDPISVDTPRPGLSWRMDDARRGARQTAYEVLVASRPEALRVGRADLWDSGKVEAGRSVGVPYAGKPLHSRDRCWWSVRVWDKDGKPSPWSRPARWEMALLDPGDWKAQWVGVRQPASSETNDTLADARWIWYPEGDPLHSAPAATRYFRAVLDLPRKPIKSATLLGAADNSFEAWVNGARVASGAGWQSASSTDIAARLKPGRNVLAASAHNTDGPAGLALAVRVTFDDGTTQRLATGDGWKAANAPAARWTAATFDDAGWQPASVIARMGDQPWGATEVGSSAVGGPAQLLRKSFTLLQPVASARVYVTAKGSYRLSINGQRVGRDILTPDWTDYRKRISYQVYDVTPLLQRGENAVGAMLGDGWYASGLGWQLARWNFGPPPTQLLMQLEVAYRDGTRETIVTDGTWKAAESPIQRSEIYAGETYDARREQPGWDRPGFDDAEWRAADVIAPADSRPRVTFGSYTDTKPSIKDGEQPIPLTAQASPTIQVTETLKPKAVTSPAPGVYVFDMGQNMVGWVQLRVPANAAPGDRIRLRFAEILQPNGPIYTQNLRKAEATDTYVCGSHPQSATWEPHFTYHGFRYVELTGYPGKPGLDVITGQVFHTAAPVSAAFDCSSPMVNQLWRNINWGQRGNMESVPTDCPQRDERLGWMGDAGIFWPTACYNRDMDAFTRKWMRDVVEAQSPEGGFSDVSPRVIDPADGAPAWGDAGIIVPYTAWRQYGDTQLVADCYPAMQRWVEYIHSANPNLLWQKRRNNDFGDWVPADSTTDKGVIATAFWAQDARMMAEMARALGKADDARAYQVMYEGIKRAFNDAYVKPDGTVGNGSQTCYVLAIHMGLLDSPLREAAGRKLVEDIEKRGGHLSTGFIGSAYLMPALSEIGRDDVAYRLLLNTTYPSWGYMISKGATTIWERWNGDTGDPGMNSFNHYAFGAVGDWMYAYLCGIGQAADSAGFTKLVIRPRIADGLTHARAEYETPYGKAATAWAKDGAGLTLDVTVPANTTATIYVPAADATLVTEGGQSIPADSAIRFVRMEDGCAVYEVPAGAYRFGVR